VTDRVLEEDFEMGKQSSVMLTAAKLLPEVLRTLSAGETTVRSTEEHDEDQISIW